MRWFRKPPPPPQTPALSRIDAAVLAAYPELTYTRWLTLSDPERAWYRDNQTKQGVGAPTPLPKGTP